MKRTLLYALSLPFFFSCQKEIGQNEIEHNIASDGVSAVESSLTKSAWTFTSVALEYGPGDKDEGPLDQCKSDDLYAYEPDGSATMKHGSIPCSFDAADGKYATWELLMQGKQLKEVYTRDMNGETAGTIVIYDITFLNASKLVISRTITEDGKTFKEYDTYTR